eukprot:9387435-Pyramimonas_sp.AAC.1
MTCGSPLRCAPCCCHETGGLSGGRSAWLTVASSGIEVGRGADLFSTSLSLLSSLRSSQIAA